MADLESRGRNQSELENIKETRKLERQKLARDKNKGFHKRNA
jgi:hypothetical protein